MARATRTLAVASAIAALITTLAAPTGAARPEIPLTDLGNPLPSTPPVAADASAGDPAPPVAPRAPGFSGPEFLPPVEPHVFLGDLRDLPVVTAIPSEVFPRGELAGGRVRGRPFHTPEVPPVPRLDPPVNPLVQNPGTLPQFLNPVRNFQALNGGFPPDPIGDVGIDHYLQAVNTTFAIYRKDDPTGTPVAGPSNINSLWAGFGGNCQNFNAGDPVVMYDQFANRFVLAQFTGRPRPEVCIAVSRTADPVTGGWNLYSFNMGGFPDYFKLGVWPTGYFLASNQGNTVVAAFDRAQMIAGNAAGMATFTQGGHLGANMMLPSDADGATPPPAGDPNVFYRFVDGDIFGGVDRLELFEFDVDFGAGTSSFTGPTSVPMAGFNSDMCGKSEFTTCVPQPGIAQTLDPIIEWPMWRFQYRNFSGNERLVGNFTVDVGDADRAGIRWFELRKAAGAWGVFQQGTHSPDATHRWMGSIAMDRAGNIALGYSASDATSTFPSLWYAGRLAGDPLGTLPQGEVQLIAGTASQTGCQMLGDGTCIGRWGDYASMNVDPVDDCTFWFTGEYFDGNRRSRIGAFRLCNDPPSADAGGPYSTNEGTDVTVDGSGSTDPNPASTLTYEWDLDNDGAFDDATGETATYDAVGQDGTFTIRLRVTDEAGASDIDSATVTVANVAPSVSLGTSAPQDEGSIVAVSGTISDPGWLDPLSATIDWMDGAGPEPIAGILENTRPDATLSFSASHRYGDDAIYPVQVCGSDDDTTTCETIPVRIDNVAPVVTLDPGQVAAILEGVTIDVSASFTDPGWLDTYTAEIDWGHADLGVSVFNPAALTTDSSGPGPDVGAVAGSKQVGDNGAFTVTITVEDDDSGTGSDGFILGVANVRPAAVIDLSGATVIDGVPTILAHAGDPVDFDANVTDPGSDDETFSWNFDDGTPIVVSTSLVNPPASDPPVSPTVQMRNVNDPQTHTFADACVYEPTLGVADDDGGTDGDAVAVLITGNADEAEKDGYWHKQYKDRAKGKVPRPDKDLDAATLLCYLEIVRSASAVYDEVRGPLATLEDGHDLFHKDEADMKEHEKLDKELVSAWLNFANGMFDLGTLVYDSDGDKVEDVSFIDAVLAAEAVRLDPAATKDDLKDQRKILDKVNKFK